MKNSINNFEINGNPVDISLDKNKLNIRNYIFSGRYNKSQRFIDAGYFDFIYDVHLNNIKELSNDEWACISNVNKINKTFSLYIKSLTTNDIINLLSFQEYKSYGNYTLMIELNTLSYILVNWNEYKTTEQLSSSKITEGIELNPKLFITYPINDNNNDIIISDETIEPSEILTKSYIYNDGNIKSSDTEYSTVAIYNINPSKKYKLTFMFVNNYYPYYYFYDNNDNYIQDVEERKTLTKNTNKKLNELILYAPENSITLKVRYNNTYNITLNEIIYDEYIRNSLLYELKNKTNELNDNVLGADISEDFTFNIQYDLKKLNKTIVKGSTIYLSGDIDVITCRTYQNDEQYFSIINKSIAPININFIKNSTQLGNLHLTSHKLSIYDAISSFNTIYTTIEPKETISQTFISLVGDLKSSGTPSTTVNIYEIPQDISTLSLDCHSGNEYTKLYCFYDVNDKVIYDDNNIPPIENDRLYFNVDLIVPLNAAFIKITYNNSFTIKLKYTNYVKKSYLNYKIKNIENKINDINSYKIPASVSYIHTSKFMLRPLKILAVGNSWTNNATSYLGNILDSLDVNVEINVSYAGSASFNSYYNSIVNNTNPYTHRKWTKDTNWVSIENCTYKQILEADDYDIITHQQVSGHSGNYASFQPYLNNIINYEKDVLNIIPIYYMHATWAYPNGYVNSNFEELYQNDTTVMYQSILNAYNQAMIAEKIDNVIPVTPIIQQTRELGISDIDTADGGSHLSTNGCYIASCIWAEMLLRYHFDQSVASSKSIVDATFKISSISEENDIKIKQLAKDIVENITIYFPNQKIKNI